MTETRALRAYAEVQLGRQRSPAHEQGEHMVPYLRAANVKDGYLDLGDVKEMNFTPAEQQRFALKPGDVLVTEGSGSLSAVGATAVWQGQLPGTVCFQNTLLRLRPRAGVDGRFLAWWCRHAFDDGMFASIATGANIFHLAAERVRSLPMAYVEPAGQRAIADFLDAETARIDALIAKKQRMRELIASRRQAAIDSTVCAGRRIRLKRVASHITSGPRGWSGLAANQGQPFLRIANLQRADIELDMNDTVFVDPPVGPEALRARVDRGDVLISITADIGSVGVVREVSAGGYMSQHVARARPVAVEPEWLAYSIASTAVHDQLRSGQYGGTKTQLSLGDIGDIWLHVPAEHERMARLDELEKIVQATRAVGEALALQVELLREHRQALITAAVTGELEIPGVAA